MNPKNLPSNRRFGLFVVCICILLSLYAVFRNETPKAHAWLVIGFFVANIAFIAPSLLSPFNKAWMKLGDLMGKVVSPLVLGVIFFVLITPIALITRLFGRDELRLKKANVSSYWIDRAPPGPAGGSFKNQF